MLSRPAAQLRSGPRRIAIAKAAAIHGFARGLVSSCSPPGLFNAITTVSAFVRRCPVIVAITVAILNPNSGSAHSPKVKKIGNAPKEHQTNWQKFRSKPTLQVTPEFRVNNPYCDISFGTASRPHTVP